MTAPRPDAARVAKSMRAVYAVILVMEALTLLLLPRTLGPVGGLSATAVTVTFGLAVLLTVLSGLQRRSWGFAAGSVGQVLFLATGVLTSVMFVLGIVFGAIWVGTYRIRRDLLASAGQAPPAG